MKTRTTGAAALALILALGGTLLGAATASADEAERQQAKVTICHEGHAITVSDNAVKAHLKHGDTLGECAPAVEPEPVEPEPTPEPDPTPAPEPTTEPEPVDETPAPAPVQNVEIYWAMPNGGTPSSVTWPQPHRADPSALACGVWYQVDTYPEDAVAAMIADGMLTKGEDYHAVISWRFVYGGDCAPDPIVEDHAASECASSTEYLTKTWTTTDGVVGNEASSSRPIDRAEAIELGCYTPPIVECEPGTLPGIINEHGDATGCTSNNPCPEVEAGEACPVDKPTVPAETPSESTDELPAVEPSAALLADTGAASQAPGILTAGGIALALGMALVIAAARRDKQGA